MGSIKPGPIDASVLRLQGSHRSESVWNGEQDKVLSCREHLFSVGDAWEVDDRVLEYVHLAGFFGIHRITRGGGSLDRSLITATITLQDVAVLLGLRVHGATVTGHGTQPWNDLVEELLGVKPISDPESQQPPLKGSSLKISWLKRHFSQLPEDADDITVQRYSRAYLLMLIGTVLFANKSGDSISLLYLPLLRDLKEVGSFSWGSATLAYLYRQLCRACEKGKCELGGPLILLQIWSWEHIHIGRPAISSVRDPNQTEGHDDDDPLLFGSQHQQHIDPLACTWLRVHMSGKHTAKCLAYYRDALDHQRDEQMTWEPYTEDVLKELPQICRSDRHIWRTSAPLICFDIVELYYPNRVMRQFGFEQKIPASCDTIDRLHRLDGRGRNKDYPKLHANCIELWEKREENIVCGDTYTGESRSEYMAWYRRITRLLITPPSIRRPTTHYQPASIDHILVNTLFTVVSRCTEAISSAEELPPDKALPFTLNALRGLSSTCTETLTNLGHSHLTDQGIAATSEVSPSTSHSSVALTAQQDGLQFSTPRAASRIPTASHHETPSPTTSDIESSTPASSHVQTPSPNTSLTPTTPTSARMLEEPCNNPESFVASPPGRLFYERRRKCAKIVPTLDTISEANELQSESSIHP